MTITDDTAMMEPRYQELATFMRAPYRPDLIDVDIAMYGIAYDGGVTNRPGARHGPREIRNQSSLMRAINHATTVNPYELCSVADVGDVRFERVYDNAAVNDDIEAFVRSVVAAGAKARRCRDAQYPTVFRSAKKYAGLARKKDCPPGSR